MSWRKHFKTYQAKQSPISGGSLDRDNTRNYQSWLPEVYTGKPNRLERYVQYDQMDMDSEINTALDTISEFSTQTDDVTNVPFQIIWNDTPNESESDILSTVLRQWSRVNDWNRRMFNTFRNTIKYGDQPFIRDPDTWKLYYVSPSDVLKVIVDEENGKEPSRYVIKNLSPNFEHLVATGQDGSNTYRGLYPQTPLSGGLSGNVKNFGQNASGTETGMEFEIDAKHVVHLALTDGMDMAWPFGNSILDSVFKTFKQKELLEDSIIIYRVQRAPERRIFYIDVGDMPAHQRMAYVERVKNEIHQRRIPTRTGGGSNMMDAQYNPLCLTLDTTIPLLDGRTLTLKDLINEYENGIENWTYSCDPITGEIVPGNITWAGVTKKNAQVIKLHFSNGKSVTLTPEHKVPVLGKGFVEAQHLTTEDELISFKRKKSKDHLTKSQTYKIYDHKSKSWKYVYDIVGNFFKDRQKHQEFTYLPINAGKEKEVIHHKDLNYLNNDPRNLTWMNKDDYDSFTSYSNKSSNKAAWESLKATFERVFTSKMNNTIHIQGIEWLTETHDVGTVTIDGNERWHTHHTFPVNDLIFVKNSIMEDYFFAQCLSLDTKILLVDGRTLTLQELIDEYESGKENIVYGLSNKNFEIELGKVVWAGVTRRNAEVMKVKIDNGNEIIATPDHKFVLFDGDEIEAKDLSVGDKLMPKVLDHEDKSKVLFREVVELEKVDDRIDTGDITIESESGSHWFGLAAGIFVHNSADGRGSKVETLPGGENLGEIDDLKFFNNKLARGLRIPSSYLPTGPDDGTATYNDGRVGTAYIQEYRFTQYCRRLQKMLEPTLDKEFKMFLKYRGYEIDTSKFEISFVEPQSFSDYREIELNSARVNVFGQVENVEYLSKQFILKKYLQLTDEEIYENERLWKEENSDELDGHDDESDNRGRNFGGLGIEGGDEIEDFESGLSDEDFEDSEDNIEPKGGEMGVESPIGGGQEESENE